MSTGDDSLLRRVWLHFGFASRTGDEVDTRLADLKRGRFLRRLGWIAVLGFIGVLFYASLQRVGFTVAELVEYWPEFVQALKAYFPPGVLFGVVPFVDLGEYLSFVRAEQLWTQAGITLAMAFAGTVFAAPIALLFGVLGSERVVPFPFNFLFRGLMSVIRAIPSLVWALIYIPLGGVSPLTATLAIGTDTIGTLGRLLTDELEEVEDGPIEGIESTGAGKRQTIVFGMISQVFRPFVAWVMYILEINVRAAVGLGIIGGGGLGYTLRMQQNTFNYTNMMATILFIVVLVITVEMISQRIRSKLRQTDDVERRTLWELIKGFPQRMSDALVRSR